MRKMDKKSNNVVNSDSNHDMNILPFSGAFQNLLKIDIYDEKCIKNGNLKTYKKENYQAAFETLERAAEAFDALVARVNDLAVLLAKSKDEASGHASVAKQWMRLATSWKAHFTDCQERLDKMQARAEKSEARAEAFASEFSAVKGEAEAPQGSGTKVDSMKSLLEDAEARAEASAAEAEKVKYQFAEAEVTLSDLHNCVIDLFGARSHYAQESLNLIASAEDREFDRCDVA